MWDIFKKRQEGDLRRAATAYRFYLKSIHQTENNDIAGDEKETRNWKGGFSKAFNQLFRDWPTPNQSKRFEKLMYRWVKKGADAERAFVLAFNEFLGQKKLTDPEIGEVLNQGRKDFRE
ncbi:MAG TPA: hypothetical protein VGB26_01065 [Nitrospiria bacterium]|jgi:hypothetical protein